MPAPLPPDSLTPVITNQTSPHVAETLRDNLPGRHTYYPYSPHAGATSLGLEGEASVAGFQAMFEGRDPTTGELLGRPHGRNAVPAFDMVLRPTKSVSILPASGMRPLVGRCWRRIMPG